ncbi:LOW QUALITY PROTEIN: la-related protein 6 [Ornithorhynchus anatinus]|uniref:LOW QUALITY PROTEIN: la-related protein 6 n=1 Tax=Ornithorhynchus anatinus TaxID=9258 RepID=UPI0010A8A07B|nr:LOW QUALITY PROTEIN: la-related protein 6 [Ornithorhynchus anatinus]
MVMIIRPASDEDPARSPSGAATSGGENGGDGPGPAWKPPEAELIGQLVDRVEFYFSDENLEKDAFLLKHIRRNKRGFVSIKLLTSFKKVKHLTRDWRATAHALRHSAALELDADGRKVRRRAPVPPFPVEHPPGRLLLVHELHRLPGPAEDGAGREGLPARLLGLFGAFGPVASVRLLRPGREPPADVRRLGGRYGRVGRTECALVEFEEEHAAARAHEALGPGGPGDPGVRVVLIGTKPPKKKEEPKPRQGDPGPAGPSRPRSLNRRVGALQSGGDESSANGSSEPDSDPAPPRAARRARGPRLGPGGPPPRSPLAEAAAAGRLRPEPPPGTDDSSDSSVTPSGSPWVRRRGRARADTRESSPGASPLLPRRPPPSDGCPVGVLRPPRGPDGSKGFRGRGERDRPEPRRAVATPGSGPG